MRKWTGTKRALLLLGVIHGIMVEDLTYEEIAERMQISRSEVKVLVCELCRDLGVDHRDRRMLPEISLAVAIHKHELCPCVECVQRRRESAALRKRTREEQKRQLSRYAKLRAPMLAQLSRRRSKGVLQTSRVPAAARERQDLWVDVPSGSSSRLESVSRAS